MCHSENPYNYALRNGTQAVPYGRTPVLGNVIKLTVIANQCAHWRGDPLVFLHFLGDCHASWQGLAMTVFFKLSDIGCRHRPTNP